MVRFEQTSISIVNKGHRMGQSFGVEIQLIKVSTNDAARGTPKKQLWVAAATPERAVPLVLGFIPEGGSAAVTDGRLRPDQIALLNLNPGEVRELTKQGFTGVV